jgi:hypothetical protein
MDSVTTIRIIAGLIFVLVFIAVAVVPYWKILEKAGFSPALSLLMIVPLANIILLYYVAFAEWKPNSNRGIQPQQWTGAPPPPA